MASHRTWPRKFGKSHGVGQVYIPQDMNYPTLRLDVDRVHAGELGLTQKDVVDNVITALNSNYMIAPNYWVDRKSGNDYYLTVQFFEKGQPAIHDMADFGQIPLRDPTNGGGMGCGPTSAGGAAWACGGQGRPITVLNNVVNVKQVQTPTEVDHYQIQRAMDVYVTPTGEDLGRVTSSIRDILAKTNIPGNVRVNLRGMVQGMEASFKSFALGIPDLLFAAVPDSDGAIQIFHRSFPDHAGDPDGICRCADHPSADPQHAECDVADGRADAGGHRGLEQHSDC